MVEHSQRWHATRQAHAPTGHPPAPDPGRVAPTAPVAPRAQGRGPAPPVDDRLRARLARLPRERLPERVVGARGTGAHGYFQPYASCAAFTRAAFLRNPDQLTPVLVRFSTTQGSRGSPDTVRDVRGFAVRFATPEGPFDLVGSSLPVSFLRDAAAFPDLVHALRPQPRDATPTLGYAHDAFWEFVSRHPESWHLVLWLMSDWALPRSYRMMPGFGVHTFRLVDARGRRSLARFHLSPLLGVHPLVEDEALECQGRDPDFHRRDLWRAIASGAFPQYELGAQLVPEEDASTLDVDLLDATQLLPVERVPVRPLGRLVLDRNPEDHEVEVERAAFRVGNLVPGIEVTEDPLLAARLLAYPDAQAARLGARRDGGRPGGRPTTSGDAPGTDRHRHAPVTQPARGVPLRHGDVARPDPYHQPAVFWRSLSDWEKRHLVEAFHHTLGGVTSSEVRRRVVAELGRVDHGLATAVARGVGVPAPPRPATVRHVPVSPSLSLTAHRGPGTVRTRRVALLLADGVDAAQADRLRADLTGRGAVVETLAPHGGRVHASDGGHQTVDHPLATVSSVLYDAVVLPGGPAAALELAADGTAVGFLRDAYRHAKPIGALGAAVGTLATLEPRGVRLAGDADGTVADQGVVTDTARGTVPETFRTALGAAVAAHRHWGRPRPHR